VFHFVGNGVQHRNPTGFKPFDLLLKSPLMITPANMIVHAETYNTGQSLGLLLRQILIINALEG